jgi:HECT-domain (ubiquitin-transferase)
VRSAGEALAATSDSSVEVPEFSELTMTAHLSDEREVPLIPDGASQPVTPQNWSDYVALTERTVLREGASALAALRSGLAAVLPAEAFALFTPTELERLVCGVRTVDIDLLQRCAEYEDCNSDSPQVKYLWEVLREFGPTERTAFLRFVWARSRLPSSAKVSCACVCLCLCVVLLCCTV